MAVSCDPATIEVAANCFQCVPKAMQKAVELYLLAKIAGLATDINGVQAIVAAANCFQCVPHAMREPVEEYLLAQIAGCQ